MKLLYFFMVFCGISLLVSLSLYLSKPVIQPLFTSLEWQSIKRIQIKKNNQSLIFQRTDDVWLNRQSIPIRDFRKKQLQTLLNLNWHRQWDLSALHLKNFGLEQPHLSIQLDDHILSFGDNAAFTNEHCYAQFNQQIGLVSPCPQRIFNLKLNDWLSLKPLLAQEKLTNLQINQCQAQQKNGVWSWSKNRSQDDLQGWLQAWTYLQAYQLTTIEQLDLQQTASIPIYLTGKQRSYQFKLIITADLLLIDTWAYHLSAQQVIDIYPLWCR